MTGLHGEFEVPAREEKTFLSLRPVCRDKILPRYAVSIGQDEVIALRGVDGFIQNGAFLEAIIRVPDVLDVETRRCFESLDQLAGFPAGAIIRNDHFKVLISLVKVAMQRQRQPLGGVISTEDYACWHKGYK